MLTANHNGIPPPVPLRDDDGADPRHDLACQTYDAKPARRLVALAGVGDSLSRSEAARLGALDPRPCVAGASCSMRRVRLAGSICHHRIDCLFKELGVTSISAGARHPRQEPEASELKKPTRPEQVTAIADSQQGGCGFWMQCESARKTARSIHGYLGARAPRQPADPRDENACSARCAGLAISNGLAIVFIPR